MFVISKVLTLLISLCLYRFARTKKPNVLVPFLPLTFIVGYQAHLAYGNKIQRIRGIQLDFCLWVYLCASLYNSYYSNKLADCNEQDNFIKDTKGYLL